QGKGPTPKAVDRPYHKAHKQAKSGATAGSDRGSGARPSRTPRRDKASSEIVAGRNAVLEALRADVPVNTLYIAGRLESDDRVKEALKIAAERAIPVLETPRG